MEIIKTKHVVGKPKHIRTANGVDFYPFKPEIEKVNIEDIAHSLSQQCRFSGHTKWKGKMKFYSVAQHSLYCSYISKNPLWALLHDASEAYSIDVPTPIKRKIPQFKYMEEKIEGVIATAFSLEWPRPAEVKEAAVRNVNDIAAATGQVIQQDVGTSLNVAGGRDDGNVYFIDGRKVTGSSSG
jgi:hypothetical protein